MIALVDEASRVDAVGPDGTLFDLTPKRGDFASGEPRSFRWHGRIGVGIGNEFDQRASFGISGNDGRTISFAPLEGSRLDVQPQTALLLLRSMATVTMLLEDGPDVCHKVDLSGHADARQESAQSQPYDPRSDRPAVSRRDAVVVTQHGTVW